MEGGGGYDVAVVESELTEVMLFVCFCYFFVQFLRRFGNGNFLRQLSIRTYLGLHSAPPY